LHWCILSTDKHIAKEQKMSRPKGSKNKPKDAVVKATTIAEGKRGRGRPAGSTNKDKEVLYTFYCEKCGWSAKSSIKTALFYCPNHHYAKLVK
jgi:hypothetical protein